MSHSVEITLVADQEISLFGVDINVHMLNCIHLDSDGKLEGYCIKDSREKCGYVWVNKGEKYVPQDIEDYQNYIKKQK